MSINKRLEGVAAARLFAATLLALVWLELRGAEAHVALTYPPARALDLDFLDNSRTKAPCGMPKGKSPGLRKAKAKAFAKVKVGLRKLLPI